MEAQSALVWPDRIVPLDAVAPADPDPAAVRLPHHAEGHHAIRFREPLEYSRLAKQRVLRLEGNDVRGDFPDRLVEFRLARVPPFDAGHERFERGLLHFTLRRHTDF